MSTRHDVRSHHDGRSYKEALAETDMLRLLAQFGPRIAGTPPLGLDLPGSDIDVLCFAPDAHKFNDAVWSNFSSVPGFAVMQLVRTPRPVVASFEVSGWRLELYGEAVPVEQQRGWRRFDIEHRVLSLAGEGLRLAVLMLRQQGLKTEPAFAAALGIPGDPYVALLELAEKGEDTLVLVLQASGFSETNQSVA